MQRIFLKFAFSIAFYWQSLKSITLYFTEKKSGTKMAPPWSRFGKRCHFGGWSSFWKLCKFLKVVQVARWALMHRLLSVHCAWKHWWWVELSCVPWKGARGGTVLAPFFSQYCTIGRALNIDLFGTTHRFLSLCTCNSKCQHHMLYWNPFRSSQWCFHVTPLRTAVTLKGWGYVGQGSFGAVCEFNETLGFNAP